MTKYQGSGINTRLLAMGIIFVVVVGLVILLVIYADDWFTGNPNQKGIENGDEVRFKYKLWRDENGNGAQDEWNRGDQSNVYVQDEIKYVIYFIEGASNNTVSKDFFRYVEGMKAGEEKTFTLEAFTDSNDDGYDDKSGEEIVGFRDDTDIMGREIILSVEIIKIFSSEHSETTTTTPSDAQYSIFFCSSFRKKFFFHDNF